MCVVGRSNVDQISQLLQIHRAAIQFVYVQPWRFTLSLYLMTAMYLMTAANTCQ